MPIEHLPATPAKVSPPVQPQQCRHTAWILHLQLRLMPAPTTPRRLIQFQCAIRTPNSVKTDVVHTTSSIHLSRINRYPIRFNRYQIMGPHIPNGSPPRLWHSPIQDTRLTSEDPNGRPLLHKLSRTQVLLTKISQTCQSVRDIKGRRKQLAFYRTSNTLKRTTSYSSPPNHSSPHSSTGDGGARDDNTKKSSSSTSSSLGGTHSPDIPTCRDPTSPAPDPAPTSRSLSPDRRPHSPPPDDEEDSSHASKDAEKDPWEHTTAARKVTASCSCRSIQRLASADLKKGSHWGRGVIYPVGTL